MDGKQTFETVLEKHSSLDATGITIPFDVFEVFGARRVPVRAEINGAVYRGSIVTMGGKYVLGIPKAFREEAGIRGGDNIVITIERDTETRTVDLPKDLEDTLVEDGLRDIWDGLSYTTRKELVRAISDAKQPQTRTRRIEKAVAAAAGKK